VIRASVKIEKPGLTVGGGDVVRMEKVGWDETTRPAWDWSQAFSTVNGDVITQNGPVWPLQVQVRVTLKTP
jgi:protein involved in polysaccharide export with SLBB domain